MELTPKMNDLLWQTYHRLIADLTYKTHRFLYAKLSNKNRLQGVIGPRGVGKTTMLLQYIKENLYEEGNAFYFSADNIYFNNHSLLVFVDSLYANNNIRYFFIDEIHKYSNWEQELKNIYDSYPDAHVVFSGSSSIDLIQGSYDLSRRASLLYLPGLSFREYLNLTNDSHLETIAFNELLAEHQQYAAMLMKIPGLSKHFQDYLTQGYYPFVFEENQYFTELLANMLDKTIYEDITNFYNLKTANLIQFKRILNFLASIPPGEVKTNNIAQGLGLDHKTATHYLEILQRTGLVKFLYPVAHGKQTLTKPAKIYLDNTTLLTTINQMLAEDLNSGNMRELAFMQLVANAGLPIYFPEKGDFYINEIIFEVGGKNKTWRQLKSHVGRKFLVKDDILMGSNHEIPLYLFGFLY